jgi:hypothetical protein
MRPSPIEINDRFKFDEKTNALAPAFMSKRDIPTPTVRKGMLYYRVNGYSLKAQDIVWILCMGKYPETELEFIDGNSMNIHPDNLRLAKKRDLKDMPQYKGVLQMSANSFKAQTRHNGKVVYLGSFKTPEEARDAVIAFESNLPPKREYKKRVTVAQRIAEARAELGLDSHVQA